MRRTQDNLSWVAVSRSKSRDGCSSRSREKKRLGVAMVGVGASASLRWMRSGVIKGMLV